MRAEQPSRLNDSALFVFFNEIGIIAQLSGAIFAKTLPNGLNSSQFGVLNWFIRVDNEATPGRLAKAFQVTGGAMTNTLKKLEAKGFVKIEPDACSGRKKRVTITKQGRAVRKKAISASSLVFEEFAQSFPMAKIQEQVKELQRVRKYLDEYRYRRK